MFFPNEYLIMKRAKDRERELLEKVRIERLLHESRANKPGLQERFLSRSGEILIFFGQKLKARYEPGRETRLALQGPGSEAAPCD